MQFDIPEDTIKVVIAGLDNAGKTSLIIALEQIYGFEASLQNLPPTLGIKYYERDYFGRKILYWDFGGQVEFRMKYLQNKMYFNATQVLYFLIDIQDEERFEDSCRYLNDILEVLKEQDYDTRIPIMICFSKSDKEIIENPSFLFENRTEMIKNLFHAAYPTYLFDFYSCSIYDLYSIVSMHIQGINRFFADLPKFENIFQEFAVNKPIKRAVLADHTGLPFINIDLNDGSSATNTNKINQLLNYHLRLFRQLEEKELPIAEMRGHSESYRAYYYRFKAKATTSSIKSVDTIIDENSYNSIDDIEMGKEINYVNYYMILFSPMNSPTIDRQEFTQLIDLLTKLINGLKIQIKN